MTDTKRDKEGSLPLYEHIHYTVPPVMRQDGFASERAKNCLLLFPPTERRLNLSHML